MPLLQRWQGGGGEGTESHKHLIELSWEFGKNVPEVQEICC